MFPNNSFKLFSITILVLIAITFAKNDPNREEESKENSIGLMARSARQYVSSLFPTGWEKSNLITNIAMPALFLLFLSSMSNQFGPKSSDTDSNVIARRKRSPISGWADNLQKILNNFQKAVEKMQKFEEELENEINDDSIETLDMESE